MGNDNLFPPGGFAPRRVRLGRLAKYEWAETIAECDVHHYLPEQIGPPAEHLGRMAAVRGLEIVDESLPGCSLGIFCCTGTITVDRAKIATLYPAASVDGVVRATLGHELGHSAMHRYALNKGIHTEEMEQQARIYAAALLLPRARLEVDATLLRLQDRADAGEEVSEFTLWASLKVVANRFGVTRSLVVERLVKLGFLRRRGRRIRMASQGGAR